MSNLLSPPPSSTALDPRAPGFLADPYPTFQELRDKSPVCVDPATGICFLLRYADVDVGLSRITRAHDIDERHIHFRGNPFSADGPAHTGPRRVIMPAFNNAAVQRLRDRAQRIVDEALAAKEGGGDLRVVDEIGFPLPYRLTCELLGVPELDDSDELRDWTWRSLELLDAFLTPEEVAANQQAGANLAAHLADVIEWKRGHLADDVLSMAISAADSGDVLAPEQLIPYVHTLYLAGMHTTVNQTALSLLALLEHREQWELLLDRPDLLGNAVEELLRFEPTAQYMRRSSDVDQEIGGVTIPAETEVLCWIGSANRDERRFGASAPELDITRENARQHLAFGKGPHTCVGSWLARLELSVVLSTIVGRYPRTEVREQDLDWVSPVIRGPEELVLRLRP